MAIQHSKFFNLILLTTGLVILGFAAIFLKLANAPGVVSAFYRLFIAAVIMLVPFIINLKRSQNKINKKSIIISIFGGVLFGIDMIFWTTGVDISGATNPTLMANTAPVWVGLGAMLFFREKLKTGFWIGLIIAFSGTTIVLLQVTGKPVGFNIGSVFGLLAGLFYGSFLLASQKARETMNTMQYFWISTFSASLVILAGVIILQKPLFDYPVISWVYFLIMAVVAQVIGWLVLNYLQGHLPASLISPTLLGQPVLTAILAIIILGETFTLFDIIGGIMVLTGIYIVHKSKAG